MTAKGTIYLARPRGFCAGVRRALDTVELALAHFGAPVYVFHEIVHNDYLVGRLKEKGVVFVETLNAVPKGSPLIFSAHGVSAAVERDAAARQLRSIDATCPLVKKIHRKAIKLEADGYRLFLIGHNGHPEIVGTLGQLRHGATVIETAADIERLAPQPVSAPAALLTQTTLSADETSALVVALKKKYSALNGQGDICYATQNRQDAVKMLCSKCDLVIIVGSHKSSNSNRLREVAEKNGTPAILVNSASALPNKILDTAINIGISAGASAPECLVEDIVTLLIADGRRGPVELLAAEEDVSFPLPAILN